MAEDGPRLRKLTERNDPMNIVLRARDVSDPFEELSLPSVLPYSSLSNLKLQHVTGTTVTDVDSAWMVNSIEESLRPFYDSSEMNWDRQEKLNDMHHQHQRFLLMSHKELGERIAFLSFRWDLESNEPIMYVYELFVEAHGRGKRIALALMQYAEDMCRKQHVQKLMLTVFCKNRAAMRLYTDKLKYVIDDDSPSKYGIENVGYEILSKRLRSVKES